MRTIIDTDTERRVSRLQEEAARIPGPMTWVDAALQIRVQRTFTQFWQERLLSLSDPDMPTVQDLLCRAHFSLQSVLRVESDALPPTHPELLPTAQEHFDLSAALCSRKVSSLSNGELRRVLCARAFMEAPALLVLDDPFGGLDPHHRRTLQSAIESISAQGSFVLLGLAEEETTSTEQETPCSASFHIQELHAVSSGEELVWLDSANVRFGDTIIFENLNWTIRRGEHWILSGENGSGKSSLLAFLTADHPQIYRNKMRLLGQVPGQGLVVWDHKRRIGFSSPEQHHQWTNDVSLLDIVASGFLDPRDPFGNVLRTDMQTAQLFVEHLQLNAQQRWSKTPYALQRLALVARAAVRRPPLLILDEPDQGLDTAARTRLWDFLGAVVRAGHSTLVVASHHAEPLPRFATHRIWLHGHFPPNV